MIDVMDDLWEKPVRIYLPDCDDDRIVELLERRRERFLIDRTVETKLVVCGKESDKYRFLPFWAEPFFEFQLVPEDESNVDFATLKLKQEQWSKCWMLAGNISSTTQVVGAIIKLKVEKLPNVKRISSYFLMKHPERWNFIFSDGGLSPNPTATELAEIAKLSAENASFHGIKKRKIAFLNAGHDNKKMTEARDIFIQENSADSIEVCEVISAQEAIWQGANIIIFPDLDAGNIAYKMCERLSGWSTEGLWEYEEKGIVTQEMLSEWWNKIYFSAPIWYETPDINNISQSFDSSIEHLSENGYTWQSAILSFSTDKSWYGNRWTNDLLDPAIWAVEATFTAKQNVIPKIIQFDAGFLPEIGKKKWIETSGRVGHYHFQSRQSFDICMGLVESLWGSQALGPFLQWLSKQANDTSRGIWVTEMEAMLQMIKEKCLLQG